MSEGGPSERVLRAVERLRTTARDGALDAIIADGRSSRAMAEWGLDAATTVFDPASVAALGLSLEGERVAVALAESVATAPVRSMALPLLQGALWIRVRAPRAQRVVAELWGELLRGEGLACEVERAEDGDLWLDDVLKTGVDRVVAFGGDERVARLRASVSSAGASFVGHGHGAGAAWVGSAPGDDEIEQIAWDFCAYDGVGCLSPEVLWVTGDGGRARLVAERVVGALERWAQRLPRGPRSREEVVAERGWRAATAAAAEWFSGGAWGSVALVSDRAASVVRARGARNVLVRAAGESGESALEWLRASARWLTTVATDRATRDAVEALRAEESLGFRGRIVAPGEMQRPPLDGEADPR